MVLEPAPARTVWWAAAGALAFIVGAPAGAFGGAWTLPQGTGQLIETFYGWTGFGPPWGGNPPANQSRFDAQTYVQFGLTDSLTVFGETAFEHYAIGEPTPDTYNGLDYSGLGLRQKLWSTGEWVFSGEATVFIPGAHDSKAPAQEGNTGWAGEARLNAGRNFTGSIRSSVGSGLPRRRGRLSPAHRRPAGRMARGSHGRVQVHAQDHADAAGLHDRLDVDEQPDLPGLAPVGGRGERRLCAQRQMVAAGSACSRPSGRSRPTAQHGAVLAVWRNF